MPEKMTETEKSMLKKVVDNAFLAMDELRQVLMRARDADNPLDHDDDVLRKHEVAGEALDKVMVAMGFGEEDEDDEFDEFDDDE